MAIDDNTSYELTGYQVKDLAQKIRAKADSASLGAAAFSNLYADLTGTPTIPTVYNGRLTIQHNGVAVGAFSANQSTNSIVKIDTLKKVTVYLFCGYVNYAIYGGKNEIYDSYVGKFYERLGDPVNTTEISYDDVLTLMGDSNVDLEIIGFVRGDSVASKRFHQISDDSYSYSFDTETENLSIVICGVDVTEAAMTSFREQITFDYSAYASQQHATIVGRKALTPLTIYFADSLPTPDQNTHLPFLSVADLKDGTINASMLNAEYVSRYMANYVNAVEGCELEWRIYDTTNDEVAKVYRADVISVGSSAGYYLYDYDYSNVVPEVHSYAVNVQYIYLVNTWTPSGGGGAGPEVITWITGATLATASAGQSAGLYGPSTIPTTVNGFVEVMDKFLNNGAIITLSDTTNFNVWVRGTTACRITRVGVDTVNGSPVLNFYFDGPGTVKRIQVATTYGSDPITVTLEA